MDRLGRLVAKRPAVILILVAIAVARVAPANAQTTLPLTSDAASNLDALVREAVANNPGVIAARAHWQALTRVPIQAATLPDPQVSIQHFTVGSPQPFSGYESSDFYYTGFGVSQDIPGPGKLRLQKSEAERDADYARRRYEAAERGVEERVKETYFELFFHAKTLRFSIAIRRTST